MKGTAAALALAVSALALGSVAPASAQDAEVVVFSTEFQPLHHYAPPEGCQDNPPLAHVLDNFTDQPIRIYAAYGCVGPYLTVYPDHGHHVSPVGSFSP